MENQLEVVSTTQPQQQQPSVFSMQAFEHAQRVAMMLSKSSLIPKEYQNNVQNTMIALEMANRIGASPLMVMQNLYIVHGKPGWSSQFIIASINSCGRFKPLRFDMLGTVGGADRSCTAWTVEKDIDIPSDIRTLQQAKDANVPVLEAPSVDMAMAKAEGWIDKNGSKWKTMPELMLRYRSAAFFGRLYAPEIMMGMHTEDEVIDIEPVIVGQNGKVPSLPVDKEAERIVLMIQDAKTVEELQALGPHVKDEQLDLFTVKMDELKAKK